MDDGQSLIVSMFIDQMVILSIHAGHKRRHGRFCCSYYTKLEFILGRLIDHGDKHDTAHL